MILLSNNMLQVKKKIILFDIDYTLFNAQLFRELFFEILVTQVPYKSRDEFLNILEEVYEKAKKKTSFFDPKSFLEILNKKIPLKDQKVLEKAIMKEEILESALYEETKKVLQELAKQKDIILGIFSWGSIPTQKAKIRVLKNYLQEEHIHVVEVDKRTVLPEILSKYNNHVVYLVDDYQEVLSKAKQLHPELYTIWIKRPETEGKESRLFDNFVPDSIIRTLREVIPLVSRKE